MPNLSFTENFAVGAEAESDYQPIALVPLTVGTRKIHAAISGNVNTKRGQLQIQLDGGGGLVVSSAVITGFRVTPNSHGPVGGSGLPFDFDVASNGEDTDEQFIAYVDATLEVTTAGNINLGIAAPNPPSSAQVSDVALVKLAALSVE